MPSTIPPAELSRTRILFACGKEELAQTIRDILRTSGFRRLLIVGTGQSALTELGTGGVDILLTTVDLPDIDAWRLTRMIRSGRFCSATVPIVVIHERHPAKIDEAIANDEGVLIASSEEPHQLPATIGTALRSLTKPTLLGVEDDRRAAAILRDSLCANFDVEIAYDGEAGVAAWKARRHRIVILDYMLPGISGAEVLQEILVLNRLQPVVILTAHVSVDTHQDLVFAGATDFLAKPFQVDQLCHTCESALRHAELMETSTELQLAEGTIFEVGNRVFAADFCLSVGKVQAVAQHLKDAVTFYRDKPPTNDDGMDI